MYAWIGGECLDLFQSILSRSKTIITIIFKKNYGFDWWCRSSEPLWFWLKPHFGA